ncbi:MAG: NYN domain-containing protein [Verrucomicrobia bacterium]|nr:NYN domain-containing protein [Verrucomicrobiota bacterium]MBV9657678.1 NYN domain-containing protein [Verrucomicrobiota bacterium]
MSSAAREYLIVDGHSVIFAWPELRALHAQRTGAARAALVRTLTDYQDHSGVRVVVVFDGRGSGKRASEATEPGGVQIFYAPAGRTADDIVERLVAKYGATHRLTVATSDRMEAQTALTFGAQSCVSAEGLRALLDTAARDFARRLRAHRASRR